MKRSVPSAFLSVFLVAIQLWNSAAYASNGSIGSAYTDAIVRRGISDSVKVLGQFKSVDEFAADYRAHVPEQKRSKFLEAKLNEAKGRKWETITQKNSSIRIGGENYIDLIFSPRLAERGQVEVNGTAVQVRNRTFEQVWGDVEKALPRQHGFFQWMIPEAEADGGLSLGLLVSAIFAVIAIGAFIDSHVATDLYFKCEDQKKNSLLKNGPTNDEERVLLRDECENVSSKWTWPGWFEDHTLGYLVKVHLPGW